MDRSIVNELIFFIYEKQVYGSIHLAYGLMHSEWVIKKDFALNVIKHRSVGIDTQYEESTHSCLELTPTEGFGKSLVLP